MVRILIVDDQRLIRYSFSRILGAVDDFVITEAASGEEARALTRNQEFDVILMDLNMPGMGGLEATRRLLASDPRVRIIGVSGYAEGPYPVKFMELGGVGYLSKDASWSDLINAIRIVMRGDRFLGADVAQYIAADLVGTAPGSGVDSLSQREIQVLHLIAAGCSTEQIAERIHLSIKTVSHHRRRLLGKLGASNDVQLAAIACRHGLTDIGAVLLQTATT
ncbi:MAG: response regulator [Gammaproteobacteria bacterium]|nr:response regulator [Gammaproteobacteria bacterium]